MAPSYVVAGLLCAAMLAYFAGLARARSFVIAPGAARAHSRTGYHGSYLALMTVLLPLLAVVLWSAFGPRVIVAAVERDLPAKVRSLPAAEKDFILSRISSIAGGLSKLSSEEQQVIRKVRLGFASPDTAQTLLQSKGIALGAAPEPYVIAAAYDKAAMTSTGNWATAALAAALAALGFGYGLYRMRPELRARNLVERALLGCLMAASGVAILTTLGIIVSVLFESIHFFQKVPPAGFFFGTVWDPRFEAAGAAATSSGQFGLLPLLWGTLFISFVALSVAVPIGLLSALYMSEYASPGFRNVAKPLIEILAGIPTIVYGFFALITFGPMIRDLGASVGLNIAASSVLTAGIVMGIMIIPYVSSLSDDIITAVPQSLRDGAYALGATKSETIKQVVFPAALPGIVGAILLAASRAIGETMIVVLAAGIAANLTINPFESVTTMTVKIVSQLTGDLEFTSPQTLVAFALGLSLFVITLLLNIYALYIVRKYREQYE
ncbi:MAG: phosphate ABC transporter permease subunit PstC [Hyphomicrobium sp.]|nr:MAG: phosphate ABC transporter permease subunit PstC [Hyphomicrobium sp.]